MDDQYTIEDFGDVVTLRQAWVRVLAELDEQEICSTTRERFLRPLIAHSFEDGVATFLAPGQFVAEWVQEKLQPVLVEKLAAQLGKSVKLDVTPELRQKPAVTVPVASVSRQVIPTDLPSFKPDPKFRFDNFIVGNSNRLAFAGANAIATEPGNRFNPLFIYGASGLGKTHLMHGIANEIIRTRPKTQVLYITAQQFLEEFVFALQNGKIDQFRRQHRAVDVWLLDDIQLIMGRDRTQEEVFHTFNWLHSLGKQIVLCSDRPPRDLLSVDERLRSRLESGLVADVAPPDTELRTAILLKKAQERNIPMEHEMAEAMASQLPGNIRRLEGALNTVFAESLMFDCPINQEIVDRVITSIKGEMNGPPALDQVLQIVSTHYDVVPDELIGSSRRAPVAHARHVAIYIMREVTHGSWKHIGAQFGNRDHTSIMHGYRKIRSLLDQDKDLNNVVNGMMMQVQRGN